MHIPDFFLEIHSMQQNANESYPRFFSRNTLDATKCKRILFRNNKCCKNAAWRKTHAAPKYVSDYSQTRLGFIEQTYLKILSKQTRTENHLNWDVLDQHAYTRFFSQNPLDAKNANENCSETTNAVKNAWNAQTPIELLSTALDVWGRPIAHPQWATLWNKPFHSKHPNNSNLLVKSKAHHLIRCVLQSVPDSHVIAIRDSGLFSPSLLLLIVHKHRFQCVIHQILHLRLFLLLRGPGLSILWRRWFRSTQWLFWWPGLHTWSTHQPFDRVVVHQTSLIHQMLRINDNNKPSTVLPASSRYAAHNNNCFSQVLVLNYCFSFLGWR